MALPDGYRDSPETVMAAMRRSAPDYVPPPPAPVTWDAYFDWLGEDARGEWVDGVIVERFAETWDHQILAGHLLCLLALFSDRHDRDAVVINRFLMRLPGGRVCREPDIAFLSAANSSRITTYWIEGPADLVVEVASAESAARDYGDKLAEYEAAGIPEYWLIDPLRREAHFCQLDDDGVYRVAAVGADGIYASRLLAGFRLRVPWLWQRPMPTIDEALADLPNA